MNEKQIRKFNEEMARKYGPHKYHSTKNIFIKFAESVKRKKIIKKLKNNQQNCLLLDVGCGAGDILDSLPVRNKIGIDYSFYLLSIAKKRSYKFPILQSNAEKLPFKDNQFNCILLMDVLEHVANPKKILNEIYRISAKDSMFILNIPNDNLINKCKKIIKKLNLHKYFVTEYHLEENNGKNANINMDWHLHHFTKNDIVKLISPKWHIIENHSIPSKIAEFQMLFFLSPKKK